MKLLLVNSVCGIRSTGRIALDIANEYKTKGYECMIAYGREYAPPECKDISYRLGSEFGVYYNTIMARIFDNDGFNAKSETIKFIKKAEEFNPDILWLHNLHGYYINIELLFRWIKTRKNMEVRWTLHDCWAITGHCAHFAYAKCEKWKTGCEKCPITKEYPSSLVFDRSKVNYQRKKELFCGVRNMKLITPSLWLANLIKESYLSEYPVEVIHNTIDTDLFKPTEGSFKKKFGIEDKTVLLGVASSWGTKKGLEDFIKLSKIIDDRFVIVMVGITRKIRKKIPESIVCIEKTNSKIELAEIYTAADLFLNLTYEDTYPTVNLEAQACGTTCITYNTGGSVESVTSENIVEQGNLDMLYKRICELA